MNKKVEKFMRDYQYSELDMYEKVPLGNLIAYADTPEQANVLYGTVEFAKELLLGLREFILLSADMDNELTITLEDTYDDIRDLVMFGTNIEEGCLEIIADVYRKCAYFIEKRERA